MRPLAARTEVEDGRPGFASYRIVGVQVFLRVLVPRVAGGRGQPCHLLAGISLAGHEVAVLECSLISFCPGGHILP
jgi:hypothetical protein